MEKKPLKLENDELSKVHEPVEHLKIWIEGKIRIQTTDPEGGPVALEAEQASTVADLLRRLCEPGLPDIPYEPDVSGYGALMHVACVDWGFCGCLKERSPLHVDLFIPPKGPVTADQFVEWLFLADNLNPNHEPEKWQRHKRALRAAFVKHMGAEIVDARELRYRFISPENDPEVKWRGPLPSVRLTESEPEP